MYIEPHWITPLYACLYIFLYLFCLCYVMTKSLNYDLVINKTPVCLCVLPWPLFTITITIDTNVLVNIGLDNMFKYL